MIQGQRQPKEALFWRSSLPSEDKQLGHHSPAARWLRGAGNILQGSTEGQSHQFVRIQDGFWEEVAFELDAKGW